MQSSITTCFAERRFTQAIRPLEVNVELVPYWEPDGALKNGLGIA